MTEFKGFFVGSMAIAALSNILPPVFLVFHAPELAIKAFAVSLVCCVVCVVLFFAALFGFKARRLWFLIPVLVALALPVYTDLTVAAQSQACFARPHHGACVP